MTEATSTDPPRSVSAVIVNHDGGWKTIRCIEALIRQTRGLDRIVVVDNGSEDGSPDRIRGHFSQVEVIELGENRGISAARNVGLAAVPSDFVLVTDNDIYPEPNALERLLLAQAETGSTVVCPRIRLIPERDVIQADGAAAHFVGTMVLLHAHSPVHAVPAERSLVGGCIGACYLLDRPRVMELGGFDETYFFYFEDLEFMLRLTARGHDIVCEPSALVFHDRGAGTPGLSFRGSGPYPARRAYLTMRNRLFTILVHYKTRTLTLLLPPLALYELAVATYAVTRGWGWQWLRAWSWQVQNVRLIVARRSVAQRYRVRKDRELFVGGPLPLAPGLVRARAPKAAVSTLSTVLNAYWRIVRHLIG